MQSSSPASSSASSSCVQSDLPVAASACSDDVWLWSPAVVVGWISVRGGEGKVERRLVKRRVWASARAEARVPMCKVRGLETEAEAEAELAAGGDDIVRSKSLRIGIMWGGERERWE